MKIGFDAKRAFFNNSGLGNYSRTTINILQGNFPEHQYYLFTPKTNPALFDIGEEKFRVKLPEKPVHKFFPGYWRNSGCSHKIIEEKLDIFHGLSHQIPRGLENFHGKKLVTIHDLIYLRYPKLYTYFDRKIYDKKFNYACKEADLIVAISEQTKRDIIEFLHISEEQIRVVYQGCNPMFDRQATEHEKNSIRIKYNLPENFMLYVGTIEERKNLLGLVKAIHQLQIDIPLVAIGRLTEYGKKVVRYVKEHKLHHIHFIESVANQELPPFYQMASLFIYPSMFEGFGIPILEALYSKTPVITSKGGCFSETGGPASRYINPLNVEELAEAIKEILGDTVLVEEMRREGYNFAQQFRQDKVAANLMQVYKELVK